MREWSDNHSITHQYFAVCSDKTADSDAQGSITEIPIEPSTNVEKLKEKLQNRRKDAMCVVFSTYNSLPVVKEAMDKKFELIFFDEAHKTASAKDSYYTMGHSDNEIPALKRLYMTATPRTYSDSVKAKNNNINSMDDEDIFGPVFYKLRFSQARNQGILVPFRITMAEVSEQQLYEDIKAAGVESAGALNDLTKMYCAWQGINYPNGKDNPPNLLQRVIVFHNTINKSKIFAGEKESKLTFENLVEKAKRVYPDFAGNVQVIHIDANTKSSSRGMALDWLRKSDKVPDTCRILSNARCLQEGVDVPALDGIVFMDPRRSGIDIIQSIGRVMRKPKGSNKKAGYVILPIPVPAKTDANEALENSRRYGPVRDVLKAIVAHDDELMALINQSNLVQPGIRPPNWIPEDLEESLANMLAVNKGSIPDYVKSIVVDLRDDAYYERYGKKLGKVAARIELIILTKVEYEKDTLKKIEILQEKLKTVVGDTLTHGDTIKTLAQHIVLYKVFNMLFPNGFNNPISNAMESAMQGLDLSAELEEFKEFYLDVEYDIRLIKTSKERQEFIKTIYDSFLRGADKKSATKNGVVYTPITLIDFIIHSIDHVLKTEFKTSFGDKNSHIKVLDPFTGAGTFITRLLESGIIPQDKLYETYKHDIYANELILLAYYVASVNIESTYQSLRHGHKYVPFDGISFTDTFDQNPRYRANDEYRKVEKTLDVTFKTAQKQVKSQKWAHLHVIMGNPPYSGGQKIASQKNKNTSHPILHDRVKDMYLEYAPKGNNRLVYNPYIKAFRWASDRIGNSGIIGFITPASFVESTSGAGVRACLAEEFTDIYCFDLRGNANLSGEKGKKSGEGIFGKDGPKEPIMITILVKNPMKKSQKCNIHYKEIDDCLNLEQKSEIISNFKSIAGINDWEEITPNEEFDWKEQRDKEITIKFNSHAQIGSKNIDEIEDKKTLFNTYSRGLGTSRDAWLYNASKEELQTNIKTMIDYCNEQDPDILMMI